MSAPMILCQTCQAFDVRSLLSAARISPIKQTQYGKQVSPIRFQDYIMPWLKGVHNPQTTVTLQGVADFFQLQPDLLALRQQAAICSLCRAVWQEYSSQCRPFELTDEALSTGISKGPIYLGTLDWDEENSQWPYVAATQFDPDAPHRSRRHLACFEVCAEYGNVPEDGKILARLQARNSNDEQCFSLAESWLQTCTESHQACQQPISNFFPTRVLDVGSHVSIARLLDSVSGHAPYAALSYCWGDQRKVLLTQDSIHILKKGIALSDLPNTLRDAVIVTQRLGIKYIWIDALCIFQDQHHAESLQDWAREASRMRDVYTNAIITIEAASARASNESFLERPRESKQPYCALPWNVASHAQHELPNVYLRPMLDITNVELVGTRIYQRGWTLQERLLAPRTLSFGTQQLSFECAEGVFDEAGKAGVTNRSSHEYLSKDLVRRLREDDTSITRVVRYFANTLQAPKTFTYGNTDFLLFGNLSSSPVDGYISTYYDLWRHLVSKFSERQLTDPRDRLPAIAGLAMEVQRTVRDTYLAGLWKSELLTSLAWTCRTLYNASGSAMGQIDKQLGAYVSSKGAIGVNPELYASSVVQGPWPESVRTSIYIAPSWSWASVRGKIFYKNSSLHAGSMTLFKRIDKHARVLDVKVEPVGDDAYGRLQAGSLKMKAPFLIIPPLDLPCSDEFVLKTWHRHTRRSNFWREPTESAISEYWQHHQSFEGQTFALVKLFTTRYLDRWSRPGHDRSTTTVLLIESVAPNNSAFRRLCCLEVQRSTLDEIRITALLGRNLDPFSSDGKALRANMKPEDYKHWSWEYAGNDEDLAKIHEEFDGAHWKKHVFMLI